MLGIAVVTYKRLDFLQRVIDRIVQNTVQPYQLVVAEDGGGDGSAEWVRSQNITVVTGANRGVCWNKNRGLFPLFLKNCDPVLLLEDDCFPVEKDWEQAWIQAVPRWRHLAYAHPKISAQAINGDGSAANPFRNPKATAQCTGVSLEALRSVGFLDTRFSGYGVGHVEWTSRFRRIKAGYEDVATDDGFTRCNIYIHGGLSHEDGGTFRDNRSVVRNKELVRIKDDPQFRFPWSTIEERAIFLDELRDSGIDPDSYLRSTAWKSLEAKTPLPKPLSAPIEAPELAPTPAEVAAIKERKKIKKSAESQAVLDSILSLSAEDRRLSPLFSGRRSYLLETGWLQSIVEKQPLVRGELSPWLNYCVIRLLSERLNKTMHLFEYGSGYSTEWYEKRVAGVTSVEHDREWHELIKTRLFEQGSPTQLLFRELDYDGQYCRAIEHGPQAYDVVVIDGRDRVNCLRNAYPFLTPSGVFVFDNSQRAHYREGIDAFVAANGFRELQLSGPAPMIHVESFTSIIYRSDNCLGI